MRAIKCKVCDLEHWGVCSTRENPIAELKPKAKQATKPKPAAKKMTTKKGKAQK